MYNDDQLLRAIRQNVDRFISTHVRELDRPEIQVLDIGPEDKGAKRFFSQAVVESVDILPYIPATYTCDICSDTSNTIPVKYDLIICTEVLEHVSDPFAAVREMRRVLKAGGKLLVTVPFNFMIHPPYPDCWRFTEYGLKILFKDFDILSIDNLPTPGRAGMPMQYTVVAVKKWE